MVLVLGGLVGVFVFGAAFPAVRQFYQAGSLGDITVPALVGVPAGLFIIVMTVIALTTFGITGRIERLVNPLSAARAFHIGPIARALRPSPIRWPLPAHTSWLSGVQAARLWGIEADAGAAIELLINSSISNCSMSRSSRESLLELWECCVRGNSGRVAEARRLVSTATWIEPEVETSHRITRMSKRAAMSSLNRRLRWVRLLNTCSKLASWVPTAAVTSPISEIKA